MIKYSYMVDVTLSSKLPYNGTRCPTLMIARDLLNALSDMITHGSAFVKPVGSTGGSKSSVYGCDKY